MPMQHHSTMSLFCLLSLCSAHGLNNHRTATETVMLGRHAATSMPPSSLLLLRRSAAFAAPPSLLLAAPSGVARHLHRAVRPAQQQQQQQQQSRSLLRMMSGGAGYIPNLETLGPEKHMAVPMTTAVLAAATTPASDWSGDLLVLPAWQEEEEQEAAAAMKLSGELALLDERLDGMLASAIQDAEFSGKAGSSVTLSLPIKYGIKTLVVSGVGKASDFNVKAASKWGESVAAVAKDKKAKSAATTIPTDNEEWQQAAAEGLLISLSPDQRYKTMETMMEKAMPLETVDVLAGASSSCLSRAVSVVEGVLLTQGLVASPPNYATPQHLADAAAAIATLPGMSLKVLEADECYERGMGAYLGVAQGSVTAPKFIHLSYSPAGGAAAAKKVALVGKGLTFDSGGYNLKVGGSMIEKMKFDMGGSGAVLGAAKAVAGLQPKGVEVHFIIAACENMISAEAMRPGDILTASNGKTIEVINTDAEGRLTLADALVYAEGLGGVTSIIDIATLTGACMVALGGSYGGVWSKNDQLMQDVKDSAQNTGELLWPMPLAAEYSDALKSTIADLKNVGDRLGGAITAALFLQEFVSDETPWLHFDIAGPVWDEKKGGATGYAVRTLTRYVESQAEQ